MRRRRVEAEFSEEIVVKQTMEVYRRINPQITQMTQIKYLTQRCRKNQVEFQEDMDKGNKPLLRLMRLEGPQITPVRFSEPTPVPSAGATGQAGQAQITRIKKILILNS